jgi:hypothetical protein
MPSSCIPSSREPQSSANMCQPSEYDLLDPTGSRPRDMDMTKYCFANSACFAALQIFRTVSLASLPVAACATPVDRILTTASHAGPRAFTAHHRRLQVRSVASAPPPPPPWRSSTDISQPTVMRTVFQCTGKVRLRLALPPSFFLAIVFP